MSKRDGSAQPERRIFPDDSEFFRRPMPIALRRICWPRKRRDPLCRVCLTQTVNPSPGEGQPQYLDRIIRHPAFVALANSVTQGSDEPRAKLGQGFGASNNPPSVSTLALVATGTGMPAATASSSRPRAKNCSGVAAISTSIRTPVALPKAFAIVAKRPGGELWLPSPQVGRNALAIGTKNKA